MMQRLRIVALLPFLLLGGATVAAARPQQEAAAPKPVPKPSSALPAGEGQAETKTLCTGCHGADSFTHQHHDRAGWDKVIDAMVAKGMDASDQDIARVAAYLTTNFGPPAQ